MNYHLDAKSRQESGPAVHCGAIKLGSISMNFDFIFVIFQSVYTVYPSVLT